MQFGRPCVAHFQPSIDIPTVSSGAELWGWDGAEAPGVCIGRCTAARPVLAEVTCAQRHMPAPPKGQPASLRVTNRALLLVICGPKSGEQVTLGCRSQALHGLVALSHANLKIALRQTAK